MINSTLLTPKELHADLLFLQSRGFDSPDLTRLHHLSVADRSVSVAQVLGYFSRRASLRGNNLELATRVHYVAEQVRAGHSNLRSLVKEALSKWPLQRAAAGRKPRKAAKVTRLESAAKRPVKRASASASQSRSTRKTASTTRVRSAAKRSKKG